MQKPSELLTAAREDFFLRGQSVADWARAHQFLSELVYAVLSGRCKGTRGESHRIAVQLGLKPGLSNNSKNSELEVNKQ